MLFNAILILSVIGVGVYLIYCSYILVRDDDMTYKEPKFLTEDEIIELIKIQLLGDTELEKGFVRELDEQDINFEKTPNVLKVDFNKKVIKHG